MTEEKKLKVIFDPGCFDNLDLTQEELDRLVADIQAKVDDGSIFDESVAMEDLDAEEQAEILDLLSRNLNDRPSLH